MHGGKMSEKVCHRKVCNNPATCWNTSTREYYCIPCARKINQAAGKDICSMPDAQCSTRADAFTKFYSDRIPENDRELECVYCEKTEEFLSPDKEGVCLGHYHNPPGA
jgi:hypothetical protein